MTSRYVWITNGKHNRKIKRNKSLPGGWTYGRRIVYGGSEVPLSLLWIIANDNNVGLPTDSISVVETGGRTRLPRCQFCHKPVVGRKFHPDCPQFEARQRTIESAERAERQARARARQRSIERAEREARREQEAIERAEQRAIEAQERAEQRAVERLSTGTSRRRQRPPSPFKKPKRIIEPPTVISEEELAKMTDHEEKMARLIAAHNASWEAANKKK